MSTSPALAVSSGIPSGMNDLGLAARGKRRIEWAFQSMPVLQSVRKHFIKTQPFAGLRVAACLNVTPEAANLLISMRDGGANLAFCAAHPLSPEDDIAASLVKDYGLPVYASTRDVGIARSPAEAVLPVEDVLTVRPNLILDHGAQLSSALQAVPVEAFESVLGGIEQTSSGATHLRRMAREGTLRYPVLAINDSQTKQLFENRYGVGQSTVEAIVRWTNVLLAGMNVVVLGYGSCGSSIALRAKGFGANIIVTEADPIRALQAAMEGHRVLSIGEAASLGDVFITATGCKSVMGREHFEKFKNGAILCNAGHSSVEIDLETLAHISSSHRPSRDFVEEFILRDGRRLYLVAGGQVIHTASAAAVPASVLDISYGNQALSAEYLVKSVSGLDKTKGVSSLDKTVYPVPAAIDRQVAKIKLESMGIKIDRLTMEQEQYLASWSGA